MSFAACGEAKDMELVTTRFRAAVLPLDKELEAALFHRADRKHCSVCGAYFLPGSNRAKYCPDCAGRMKRIKADEPTGALDSRTGQDILALFQKLNDMGNTIIMITHDLNVAQHSKRIAHLNDGVLSVSE